MKNVLFNLNQMLLQGNAETASVMFFCRGCVQLVKIKTDRRRWRVWRWLARDRYFPSFHPKKILRTIMQVHHVILGAGSSQPRGAVFCLALVNIGTNKYLIEFAHLMGHLFIAETRTCFEEEGWTKKSCEIFIVNTISRYLIKTCLVLELRFCNIPNTL